ETAFPFATVGFSPDGRQLAIGQDDGTIVFCELATGKEARRLRGLPNPYRLVFHPDGSKFAVASLTSRAVVVYDAATGQVKEKLADHPAGVRDLAWHPLGHLLATASGDDAYLWDAATGRQHAVLRGHQGTVAGVAFLPPGDRVLSASWDGTTRVWEAATGRFL